MKVLPPHVGKENAYLIPDYPYGFRLRCQMKVWIEYKQGFGFRYCTQTTNPKKSYEVWNTPKHGTYHKLAMALYLDENEHVQQSVLNEWSEVTQAEQWLATYKEGLLDWQVERVEKYIEAKKAYDAKQAEKKQAEQSATPQEPAVSQQEATQPGEQKTSFPGPWQH